MKSTTSKSFRKKSLSFLILITICFNYLLFHKFYQPNLELKNDSKLYDSIAKAILKGNDTLEDGSDIGLVVTPGYSIFISIIYFVCGYDYLNVYYLQIVLNILIIAFYFHICSWVCKIRVINILSSIWLIFYVSLWTYNFTILMEICTVFLLFVMLFFIGKYFMDTNKNYLYAFSVLSGLLIFVNNRFFFHYLLSLVLLYLFSKNKKLRFNKRIRDIALSFVIVIIILLPWHIRQFNTYDRLVFFAPQRVPKQEKLFMTFGTYEECLKQLALEDNNKNERLENIFTKKMYWQLKNEYENRKIGLNKYWSRLIGFWEVIHTKPWLLYGLDNRIVLPGSPLRNTIEAFFLIPMMLLFPVSLFLGYARKHWFILTLNLFVICHWFVHTVIHYKPRYRLTIIPLIFLLGWYAIAELIILLKPLINKYIKTSPRIDTKRIIRD